MVGGAPDLFSLHLVHPVHGYDWEGFGGKIEMVTDQGLVKRFLVKDVVFYLVNRDLFLGLLGDFLIEHLIITS